MFFNPYPLSHFLVYFYCPFADLSCKQSFDAVMYIFEQLCKPSDLPWLHFSYICHHTIRNSITFPVFLLLEVVSHNKKWKSLIRFCHMFKIWSASTTFLPCQIHTPPFHGRNTRHLYILFQSPFPPCHPCSYAWSLYHLVLCHNPPSIFSDKSKFLVVTDRFFCIMKIIKLTPCSKIPSIDQ